MYKLSKLIITVIAIVSILCCVPVASAVDATEPPTEPTEATSEQATQEIKIPMMSTGPKALYFKPNANWSNSNARFAIRFTSSSGGEVWVSMNALGNGYYKAYVPSGNYESFIFLRMDPSTDVNSWSTKWNYSQSLTFPENGLNCFTVTESDWNEATGTWSIYSDPEELPEEPSEQEDNHDAICCILLAIGILAGCMIAQGLSFWKW